MFGSSVLMGSTAMAAISPDFFSKGIFHASRYGPFEAVARNGEIVGVNNPTDLDARPAELPGFGILDRICDKTLINYPMVRKPYLDGWRTEDAKPELRGKEEYVRIDWDTVWSLISKTLNDSWSNAGMFRSNVLQGRLTNLLNGCINTAGDWSTAANQVTLPRVIGDMEVYSTQSAWETIRDETKVFALVGCDPIKNSRIEFRIADHGMYAHREEIRDASVKLISIDTQRTTSDKSLNADWFKIIPDTNVALFNAIAYHVLDKSLDDKEYMAKYAVGGDKWIAYVKGDVDGAPKPPSWAAAARWVDIVMPTSTTLEQSDINSGGAYSNEHGHAMKKVIEPTGKSLSDYKIFERMAQKMDLWTQFTDSQDAMFHIKAAYGRSTASKAIPFEDFRKKGEVGEEARKWVRHGAFHEDPDANPLHATSGKIKMFCEDIANMDIEDCPSMHVWMEKDEYLGNAKEGQLHMVSRRLWLRLHSQMADSGRLRRLYTVRGREPVRSNAADAAKRGIEDSDRVELYNDRGAVVSDGIMPGVISIHEGCWPQMDGKRRCNSGLVDFSTSSWRRSGLSRVTTANTALISLKKCEDPDGPNMAYVKPAIIDGAKLARISVEALGIERFKKLTEALYTDLTPCEKIFYERGTARRVPREVSHYTRRQWKGLTPSMLPRTGLNDAKARPIMDYLTAHAVDAN